MTTLTLWALNSIVLVSWRRRWQHLLYQECQSITSDTGNVSSNCFTHERLYVEMWTGSPPWKNCLAANYEDSKTTSVVSTTILSNHYKMLSMNRTFLETHYHIFSYQCYSLWWKQYRSICFRCFLMVSKYLVCIRVFCLHILLDTLPSKAVVQASLKISFNHVLETVAASFNPSGFRHFSSISCVFPIKTAYPF